MEYLIYCAKMLTLGFGVGILSGGLGLGGGILMVPAFQTFIHGMDPHTAKGTSLFIIIFVALYNAWRLTHNWPERPWRVAAYLAVGSVAGSFAGVKFTAMLDANTVVWIFIGILGFLAIRTFFIQPRIVREEEVRKRRMLSLVIGLFTGLAAGASGIGGGAVLVPLALMAGICSNERVVGLSNMVMVLTCIAGSIANLQATPIQTLPWVVGHVDFSLVLIVLLGSLIGSGPGRKLNDHLPLKRRRVAMGLLLLVITTRLLYRVLT